MKVGVLGSGNVGQVLAAGFASRGHLGGIEMSLYLEPLAMIWIIYGLRTNTWNHAFKLLLQ